MYRVVKWPPPSLVIGLLVLIKNGGHEKRTVAICGWKVKTKG